MVNFTYNGRIELIIGSMSSGKSTELLRRCNRYGLTGKTCILVKYSKDIRYDKNMIVTHDNIKKEAITCTWLYEIDAAIQKYDIIGIDEIQFYKDAHIFCDKWACEGKIVIAGGLSGNI